MFEFKFTRRFSMAHRLVLCGSSKCEVPHGHNEFVKVRLAAKEAKRLDGGANMVESFENAKRTWHKWIDDHVDHAFQLGESDPLLNYFIENEPHTIDRIMVSPGDPTTEVLAACFKSKLSAILRDDDVNLFCLDVTIEETPTNTVTFSGDPEAFLPEAKLSDPWWTRSDMAINDLRRSKPLTVVAGG